MEKQNWFRIEMFKATSGKNGGGVFSSDALIKISVEGRGSEIVAAEGNGPVNALDNALRKAISNFYDSVSNVELVDFKVSMADGKCGSASKVKVIVDFEDGNNSWTTEGVSVDIIEASFQALISGYEKKLAKDFS